MHSPRYLIIPYQYPPPPLFDRPPTPLFYPFTPFSPLSSRWNDGTPPEPRY